MPKTSSNKGKETSSDWPTADERAAVDQLESLLPDCIGDSIFIHDLKGQILYVNEAACETRGYSRSELTSMTIPQLDTPESAKKIPSHIKKLLETGRAKFESSQFKKDGSTLPIEVNARLIEMSGENFVVSVARDISKRKLTESKLKASEEKYRLLLDTANDAIFVADAQTGILVDTNQKAAELIGRSKDEIIGMHQAQLHPEEKAAEYRKIFEDYVMKGQGVTVELLAKHKSGHNIPIEISSSVLEVDGKQLIKGIFRDLTARNQEKALSDSLNEINKLINSTLNFFEVLQRVVSRSSQAMGSETTVVLLKNENRWAVHRGHNVPDEMLGRDFGGEEVPHVMLAAQRQAPVVINCLQDDERMNTDFMKSTGICSTIVVPLIVKGEVIGCKTFSYHSAPVRFTPAQIDFAVKLGASVSLALENARLYEEQRTISETLQTAILTLPGDIPNIEFGHVYRSGAEAALVGGDFYDIFALHGNRIGIMIGDVSGKGLEAASLTLVIKNLVKAYAHEGHAPAAIMSRLNSWAVKETDPSIFVSVFFGVLETTSGILTYCCAGHLPPIIMRQDGSMSTLEDHCPVIGVLELLEARDAQTRIHEDDVLTLYTDGVTEARSGAQMLGEDGLRQILESRDSRAATEIPRFIIDELVDNLRYDIADDIAIVSVALHDQSSQK